MQRYPWCLIVVFGFFMLLFGLACYVTESIRESNLRKAGITLKLALIDKQIAAAKAAADKISPEENNGRAARCLQQAEYFLDLARRHHAQDPSLGGYDDIVCEYVTSAWKAIGLRGISLPPFEARSCDDVVKAVCDSDAEVCVLHFYRAGDVRAREQTEVLAKLNAWYENDSPGRVRFINIDLGAVRPPDYPDRQPGVRIVRVWRGEFKEELRQHPYAYGHKLSSTASGGIELETTSYSAPYLAVDAVIDQLSTGVSPPEWPMVGRRGVPGWNFLTAK